MIESPAPLLAVALIVAGGRGARAGEGLPKQYRPIGGVPMLRRSVLAFLRHPGVATVQVVIHPDHQPLYDEAVAGLDIAPPVIGGAERQESVRLGLRPLDAAAAPGTVVMIHDAARPMVSAALLDRCIAAAEEQVRQGRPVALVPALPFADSLRRGKSVLEQQVDRAGLLRVQTPQCFDLGLALADHEAAAADGRTYTDDAAMMMETGVEVAVVMGDEMNLKVTRDADFGLAERLLETRHSVRTGLGFDVHAFVDGDHVWIGGIEIAHGRGLKGHSDADVGLHALTDALLGAIAAGDIGDHFPPSDPQWRGAASSLFLDHARQLVEDCGGQIEHVDLTIICEAPKIGPHRAAIRARIGALLRLPLERVSVKATTTERLGFTGRSEGIAAQAVATVRVEER